MRIGHYAPDIWAQGGMATYIRRLGEAQAAEGHTVCYFSKAPEDSNVPDTCLVQDDEDLFRRARGLELDVLHLHAGVTVLPADRVPTVRTMHGVTGCPSGSRYLARSGQPCDRIYGVGVCLWGHLVDRCGSLRPRSIRLHVGHFLRDMELVPRLHTFTVSRFSKDFLIRSGCPADKIHVLPSPAPGVSEAFVPLPREGPPRFLFLGRIVPEKGLAWLLRALARVKTDIHLDVAGDGYLMEPMRALTDRLGLQHRVTFHGWAPPERVEGLIKAARAVVVPSVWHEPAGLVTLEAAAYGRPVIASRVGGIPEYAREAFALLVPPNDVGQLAESITRLAEDPALAERMGLAGLSLMRDQFSMDTFLRRQDQLYTLALDGNIAEVAEEG